MRKFKTLLVLFLITMLLAVPANISSALELNLELNKNILYPKDKIQLPFISRHEVVKAVPIYRVMRTGKWYQAGGTHVYTMNKDEFDSWLASGKAVDDGIAGYISPVPLPYTAPLYNMVKNSMEQYFAPTEESRDGVIIKYNYENYGVLGYIVPLEDAAHGNAEMLCWYKGNWQEAKPKTSGIDVAWNADHYYNAAVKYVDTDRYDYNGPQFRCWNEEAVLQEIDVVSPAGGETLTAGTKAEIKWSTLIPGGNINLYYSTDGDGWGVIQEGLDNNGYYTWTVPNEVTTKAVVEARWSYEGIDVNCFDQSDKYFTIKEGSISPGLIAPKFDAARLFKPAAPTGLITSSGLGQKQPYLSWKDNANNETGYIVERKEVGGTFGKLTETAANTVKYIDKTAKAGVKYVYRVKAVNVLVLSSSDYSNEAAGAVFAIPEITLPKLPAQKTLVNMLFTLNQDTYSVNGETKKMDVSPVSIEGRTMLPIRFAADPLGAVTAWDGNERKVTVTLGETKLELWIGSSTALLNGSAIQIDPQNPEVKPLIINDRTMLPMRFVAEKLGCGVEWVDATKQIKVNYPNSGTWLDPQPEPPIEKLQFKF